VDVNINLIAQGLLERGWQLSTCESCSGGWIAKRLTDVAGSSAWFAGALVTYSNALKQHLAGVSARTLAEHGAVSEAVAQAMATGCARATQTQACVAVTGIAGPGGGSAAKPVGMVCFGWHLSDRDVLLDTQYFHGDREQVRRQTVDHALTVLADLLQHGTLLGETCRKTPR